MTMNRRSFAGLGALTLIGGLLAASGAGDASSRVQVTIDEWKVPVEKSRPHDPEVAPDGSVWYTAQITSKLGRLDPKTGTVTEFASPGGPKSQPYGITHVGPIIWYSESGVQPNTLVRFDPASRSFETWPIPSGGGVVRHMVTAPNGELWLACSGVDRIARVRIREGA